jgi:hypothetical protein
MYAIRQFRIDTNSTLQLVDVELSHTEQYLYDQFSHWNYDVQRHQEDVGIAEIALEHCNNEDDEDYHDCSSEEEQLDYANQHLEKSQDELQDVRKKSGVFEDVVLDYRRQSIILKSFIDSDLQRGDTILGLVISDLYRYIDSTYRSLGTSSINITQDEFKKFNLTDKMQMIGNISQSEGLPYSEKMKKYLIGLCFLEDDDFQIIQKYLNSKDHKPAIFDNQTMAESILKRDFPSMTRGWDREWEGVTVYFSTSSSSPGDPRKAHRTILAKYHENVLIHELAHQLHSLAWSETGQLGTIKYKKIKDLYENIKSGRVRPLSEYIDNEGEYFAYSVEWFFHEPVKLKERDPEMFKFLNDQIFRGMYYGQ